MGTKEKLWGYQRRLVMLPLIIAALFFGILLQSESHALTLNVVDNDGNLVNGFRWLVQKDTTFPHEPGVPTADILAVNFHRSYAPPVDKGQSDTDTATVAVSADTRYYVSVLPFSGYSLGGAAVAIGQSAVTVRVNQLPLPTAQISVLVFEDNHPINNAPDLPPETGLANFKILISETPGYGVVGAQLSVDAFGNPLGTTYQQDVNGDFILNPDGTPVIDVLGTGVIRTDADGRALIKYLPPGKFGIRAVPPLNDPDWIQTSTIEGTPTVDAWVEANEPPYFVEFGPPGPHVFIGFVRQTAPLPDPAPLPAGTLSGQIVNLHNSRPPDFTFWPGHPIPECYVGLNTLAGVGEGIVAQPCNPDSTFTIDNVPPGDYQLVVWDLNMDVIFTFLGVTVPPAGGDVDIDNDGDPLNNTIPVFNWFGSLQGSVFNDANQNGFRDPGEPGIGEQAVNLRFRNGIVYQATATNLAGDYSFPEIFPFFNWLIVEVDFLRLKATGATIVVDNGGEVLPDNGWTYPSRDRLTPQEQAEINPNTGNNLSRTETGPVLLEGIQTFLGTTNVIDWGKIAYAAGENGGISGIVFYATTRAEDDPRLAAGEPWEPGIPRVQVNLYADFNQDGNIDDLNGDGGVTLADVDNYPFGWIDGGPKGDEDLDRNGDGIFTPGDAIQITWTDSWDDSLPTECVGPPFVLHGVPTDCYDGLRNFNQVRPAVFDGGYAFFSYWVPYFGAPGAIEAEGLPLGDYVVEAIAPPQYKHVKEEDRNVDFGDAFIPSPLAEPVSCVGDPREVPPLFSFLTDENGDPLPGVDPNDPDNAAPFAGDIRPLCDRKLVTLTSDQFNAVAEFFLFTEVPVAGQIVGINLNDLANEFDPTAPTFGEKQAPPWLPVSIRDYTGNEISRTYTDEYGAYNTLVPSTYSVNLPQPTGVSPNMLTVCLNSPGPIPDPNNPGEFITDPFFKREYSQFCYTFQYMPGTTTYLDTPVLPIAAFTGPGSFPLDCEFPDGTPIIHSVEGPQGGPYVPTVGQSITIVSAGPTQVPNPEFEQGSGRPQTITRDYGFGNVQGSVTIGGTPLQITSWTADTIAGTVAPGTQTGQLVMIRGDNGKSTIMGLTMTVGPVAGTVRHVAAGQSIQAAIDIAQPGDLILVAPGSYEELVIMWKDVQLQGWGAASTTINAVKSPATKLQNWRDKVSAIMGDPLYLLPGQEGELITEEGPGIFVFVRPGDFSPARNPRIDGFTVTGADHAGGIIVNGNAAYLQISNNRIIANQGVLGGGIRLGHPFLTNEEGGPLAYTDGNNDHIVVRNNHITQNGSNFAAAGGLAICTGADFYEVAENFICGNFTTGDGGGIGHLGLSDQGHIADNTIIFNESFYQATGVHGGGIFIGGLPGLGGGLSPGSGSVSVVSNLIQGNLAGAGDGGGIRTQFVNGADVQAHPNTQAEWYSIHILNNMIVNNVAGLAGGGISLQDTVIVNIVNNTVANNDSTATASTAFSGGPSVSTKQPAGIVARAHSTALANAFGADSVPFKIYSNPVLVNTIIWHNRSFHWDVAENNGTGGLLPDVGAGQPPVYADLAVLGTATPFLLDPRFCILSETVNPAEYDPSNMYSDPMFVSEYFNGERGSVLLPEVTTPVEAPPAFDEGGNFINIRFGPLSLTGDYHLQVVSPAAATGDSTVLIDFAELATDFDGDFRFTDSIDIGADEITFVPVYRFWSPVFFSHFYTISEAEKDAVMANPDWVNEGVAFYAYSVQTAGTLPVYRFWSPVYFSHFYTISEAEKDIVLLNPDWIFEGVAYYAYPTNSVPGTLPVYRFWSPVYFSHFYTISEAEKDIVLLNPDWIFEGVAFYAIPNP
ncbi:MAG: hypothetical protein JRI22_11135 [Deltaproteobacteria bacterium]|nr:hypothetical protein [Deltaproteobacteria bacterium]